MATTLSARDSADVGSLCIVFVDRAPSETPLLGFGRSAGAAIWIKKLGKARVVGQVLEVGVVPRLVSGSRIQTNGLGQAGKRLRKVAGKAVQSRHPVPDEV